MIRRLFLVLTVACALVIPGKAAETLRSPDGKIVAIIELNGGQPLWSVAHGGDAIIQDSLLGVETAPDGFRGPYQLVATETASGDTTWKPVWGFLSEVRDHYRELTLQLRETAAPQRLLHVVLRAYNEGVAVRYVFPRQPGVDTVTVKKLLTEFKFGGDKVIYTARDYQYGNATIAAMKKSEGAVTMAVGGTREKLSMISTVTNKGEARWMIIDGNFNADRLIEFLEALIRDATKKVFLILDNLRAHVSQGHRSKRAGAKLRNR